MKTKLIATIVLLLCILIGLAYSEPFNIDSLLIQSIGGPKAIERIKKLKSFRAEGVINWNKVEGRYTADYLAPDKIRIIADFDDFSIVQGYDGTTPWQKDIHGRVFDLYGSEKSEFMRNFYLMTFGYLPEPGKTEDCQYVKTIPQDSLRFHEVSYSMETGDTLSLVFEESTGMLQMIGAYYDNILLVTILTNFDTVENIVLPFYSMTSSPQAPITTEIAVDSFELDVNLDPAIFAKPKPELFDFHFPADSEFVTIPFKNENGHIAITTTVNGKKKGRFILDTGASTSYYHSEFVNDMELESFGEVPAMGLGGFQDMQMVSFDSINIGGLALYEQTAGIIPLYELELQTLDDVSFGGILGYDFFVRFPMKFDFIHETLRVYNPKTFSMPGNGTEIPFNLTMMIPTVSAKIGGIKGDFIVDLGNAFGLILHKSFGEKLVSSGIISVNGQSRRIGGVGQGVSGIDVDISEVTLSSKKLKIPEAILVDPSAGLTGSRLIAGNIGTKILEQYSVLFDYPNQRLIIFDAPKTD